MKAILSIENEMGYARVADIAKIIGIKQATMHTAVRRLIEAGYVTIAPPLMGKHRQLFCLTPEGREIAEKIKDRHDTICEWLIRLGIPQEEAEEEACHMEHGITDNTMEVLRKHVQRAKDMMAMAARHEGMAELMKRMPEVQQPVRVGGDDQENEKLRKLVQASGGESGVKRRNTLVKRAGGEDNLEKLVDIIEDLDDVGGVEALGAAVTEYRKLQEVAARWGGVSRMYTMLNKLEKLGGKNTVNLLDTMAKDVGDAETLLKRMKRTVAIWCPKEADE